MDEILKKLLEAAQLERQTDPRTESRRIPDGINDDPALTKTVPDLVNGFQREATYSDQLKARSNSIPAELKQLEQMLREADDKAEMMNLEKSGSIQQTPAEIYGLGKPKIPGEGYYLNHSSHPDEYLNWHNPVNRYNKLMQKLKKK